MKAQVTKRQSNLECLRILAMLMIVASHYAAHGIEKALYADVAYTEWAAGSLINRLTTAFLNPGGEVGVAALLMITGYFQIRKDRINLTKIVLQCLYYSCFSLLLCGAVLLSGHSFPYMGVQNLATNLIRAVLNPVTSTYWWFVALYVFLMLLSPVLNGFLRKLTKKGFIRVLIIAWFLWYAVAHTIGSQFFDLQKAMLFYSMGAFVRLYGERKPARRPFYFLGGLVSWCLTALCFFLLGSLQLGTGGLRQELMTRFFSLAECGILVPLCAWCAFRLFEGLEMSCSRTINTVASTTFGVYLIHDSLFGRPFIWYLLLDVVHTQYPSVLYPLYAAVTILGVFLVCSLLDLIRIRVFEPKATAAAEKIWGNWKQHNTISG